MISERSGNPLPDESLTLLIQKRSCYALILDSVQVEALRRQLEVLCLNLGLNCRETSHPLFLPIGPSVAFRQSGDCYELVFTTGAGNNRRQIHSLLPPAVVPGFQQALTDLCFGSGPGPARIALPTPRLSALIADWAAYFCGFEAAVLLEAVVGSFPAAAAVALPWAA